MWSLTLKITLAAVGLLLLGFVGILVFTDIWARVGIGAALVVVVGGMLLVAWLVDRREARQREEF